MINPNVGDKVRVSIYDGDVGEDFEEEGEVVALFFHNNSSYVVVYCPLLEEGYTVQPFERCTLL